MRRRVVAVLIMVSSLKILGTAIVLCSMTLIACSGAAQVSPGGVPLSFNVGDRPRGISVGDLNGDGKPDLAVANADSDTLTVLLQLANGGAFVRKDYPAGNEPSDIELGDFDRDGDLDAAFANHETSMITVLLNDGDGRFVPSAGSPFETGAAPHLHGLAVGDFDGDDWLDIAADSSDRDVVVVLLGGRDGFRLAEPLVAGRFPYFRIDTLPTSDGADILVPSPKANRVSIIAPRRSAPRQLIHVGDANGAMIVINANLDGDNQQDVVATIDTGVAMWAAVVNGFALVPGTPVPFDTPTEITAGDVDGDGLDEIAVGLWDDDQIYLLKSDGTSFGSVTACFRPAAIALADLDGDGKAELIAGCWNEGKILVFNGNTIVEGGGQ